MSTAVKRPQPKSVRVMPTVTDPTMRNARGPAEMLLDSETGGDQPDDHDTVFGGTQKTREEQEVSPQDTSSQNSTMLIVVFALIVIALVALIVWMLMKQSNDKKDEDEMRGMIQPRPHPRNNMPPNYGPQQHPYPQQQPSRAPNVSQGLQGPRGVPDAGNSCAPYPQNTTQMQMSPADFEAHQRNMAVIHQQQAALQQQMEQMNADLGDDDADTGTNTEKKSTKSKSFSEVMAEKDGKSMLPLKEPLLDEEAPVAKPKFTKKNPHPGILRPGSSDSTLSTSEVSDVDDVLAQTNAMLKAGTSNLGKKSKKEPNKEMKPEAKKVAKKETGKVVEKEDLTDSDRALLDLVSSNVDGSDGDLGDV